MGRASRRWAPFGLAAIFTGSGLLHLVRPDLFLPLIPRGLPVPDLLVAVSGLAELACAAGLVSRRPWAGPVSAVAPGGRVPGQCPVRAGPVGIDRLADPRLVAAAWLRLPLQLPLIWAALQAPRGER